MGIWARGFVRGVVDLWLRVCKNYKIANIDKPLLRYRFNVKGMTLSRKWEQFYFVNLALVSYWNPRSSFKENECLAEKRLKQYDKSNFLEQVYTGTITELFLLNIYKDSLMLAIKSFQDLGFYKGCKVLLIFISKFIKCKSKTEYNKS